MRFLITCPFGLTSILGNELKYLKLTPQQSFATGVYVEGDYQTMIQINLWSRIANKVYLQNTSGICKDFDSLFSLVQTIDRKQYINTGQAVTISVHSKGSQLDSSRTIQSIANKAIFKQLSPDENRSIDTNKDPVEIFIMLENNIAFIFINSSGKALYQRGYRIQTGDAPLKENIAAALVILSRWKFSTPLWDPCCGSGTLGIEAAMLAKNIAPGLLRNFAFEQWKDVDQQMLLDLKNEAQKKQFTDKKYQILCSDIDEHMTTIAQKNAEKAGVADTIIFETRSILSPIPNIQNTTIICNPPYGKRLISADLEKIYKQIINSTEHALGGGFITSWKECESFLNKEWKQKKLFNGADECVFYSK